jgi:hypothetical protein
MASNFTGLIRPAAPVLRQRRMGANRSDSAGASAERPLAIRPLSKHGTLTQEHRRNHQPRYQATFARAA